MQLFVVIGLETYVELKVREFGLLTVPHVCVLSILLPNFKLKHFTAESYRVSGRKRMRKTVRTSNRKIQRYTIVQEFSIVFPNNCKPLPASGKHLPMPQMETCGRTCAVGCTAGNMQHSGVAYFQSVKKCIEYVICTVWRIFFHRGIDKIRRNDHL